MFLVNRSNLNPSFTRNHEFQIFSEGFNVMVFFLDKCCWGNVAELRVKFSALDINDLDCFTFGVLIIQLDRMYDIIQTQWP